MVVDHRITAVEWFSVLTCVIAASVGPVILLGMEFTISFSFIGLFFSILSLGLRRLVTLIERRFFFRYNERGKALIGFIMGFVPIFGFAVINSKENIMALFHFNWNTGFDSFPVLLSTIIVLFALLLVRGNNINLAIYFVGIRYLLPLFLVLIILPAMSNSEGKVFFLNVAVIYFLVHLVLSKWLKGISTEEIRG